MFDTAATRNFHSHHSYAFDIVVGNNGGEFVGVVHTVKFRATDECDVVANEIVMEVAVGKCGAICRYQKICAVKIRCVYGNEFYLHRPLGELTVNGC